MDLLTLAEASRWTQIGFCLGLGGIVAYGAANLVVLLVGLFAK